MPAHPDRDRVGPAAAATPDAGSPTAEIAARVSATGFESLDERTIAAVKLLIADGVAVAVAGSAETAPRLVAEYLRELSCGGTASVWGHKFKTAPVHAAYANAAAMHVLDFEPMSSPPTHAVSPTLPVAMALGEALRASGSEIIAACAKGFEMQGRVLLASSHDRGALRFHTPGVVGVMGAAVAAAHLLGLGPERLCHALGMAASRCGGLSANTGSMVKCTHCGNVAAAGLEAAMLAARGFTAHPGIFEAPHGYVATFFPRHFDYGALLDFGRPFRCVEPGMAIKFYPSKYPTHFGIAAALGLRDRVGGAAAIERVRVDAPDIADADRPQPRSGLEGKFSIQYTVAAALLDGAVGMETFTDERRWRADMTGLLQRIELARDPSRSRDTSNMHVEVTVTLRDGRTLRSACSRPPGFWGEPIDMPGHRAKVASCLGVRLTAADAARALELLGNLDQLGPEQVQRLLALLA